MTAAAPPRTARTTLCIWLALSLLAAALSWRQIESQDIGYHLAYGERFWRTLAPVDDDSFVYATVASPNGASAVAEPGPGCWRDDAGDHRFPNANWLSQAVMWGAFRLGGETGITLLAALLLLAITAVQFLGLRACGAKAPAAAAATFVVLLVMSGRLEPRPELFGYLLLSWMCLTLLRFSHLGEQPTWRTVAGLVAAQVLLVNLHSYFVLGPLLSCCFLLQAVLTRGASALLRTLAILAAAQALACFVNPWTWRLALLPLQTAIYLREHGVSDAAHQPRHPWSAIAEFQPMPLPWHGGPIDPARALFYALLAAAALAFVASLRQRRFGHAAALLLAGATSLSMRRNIPPAALILVPIVCMALQPWLSRLAARWPRTAASCNRFAPAVIAVACIGGSVLVAGGLYARIGSHTVFGSGFSPLYMPVGVARWLDEHRPAGRLWTDFNSSSNLHFLAASRPEVPLLTNTWASPPAVMRAVLDTLAGAPFVDVPAPGVEVIVLETDGTGAPMLERLARDAAWTLVHVEPRYVVFLRTRGTNEALAARERRREDQMVPEAWLQSTMPPALLAHARRAAIGTFARIGWRDAQIGCTESLLATEPRDAHHWAELGLLRGRRGMARAEAGDLGGGLADLAAAERALRTALGLRPGALGVQQNLTLVQQALARAAGR